MGSVSPGIVEVIVTRLDSSDGYRRLAAKGVQAPSGSRNAIEAAEWMGLGSAGGVRVGLARCTSREDVAGLVAGLLAIAAE